MSLPRPNVLCRSTQVKYRAAQPREHVAAKAVKRFVDWFGKGSWSEVLVGMVDTDMLDEKELDEMAKTIEAAQKERT
jgi:BlaI family penicillinase repressor